MRTNRLYLSWERDDSYHFNLLFHQNDGRKDSTHNWHTGKLKNENGKCVAQVCEGSFTANNKFCYWDLLLRFISFSFICFANGRFFISYLKWNLIAFEESLSCHFMITSRLHRRCESDDDDCENIFLRQFQFYVVDCELVNFSSVALFCHPSSSQLDLLFLVFLLSWIDCYLQFLIPAERNSSFSSFFSAAIIHPSQNEILKRAHNLTNLNLLSVLL